jgi:polysaccharide biosynthesis/export protein
MQAGMHLADLVSGPHGMVRNEGNGNGGSAMRLNAKKSIATALALRHAAASTLCLALAGLGGCALAPGMSFSPPKGEAGPNVGTSVGAGAAPGAPVPDSVVARGIAGAPTGTLVEITRDLVTKEAAEQPKSIPADVEKLFAKPTPYEIGPGDILTVVVWDHPELNLPASGGGGDGPSGASSVAPGYTVDNDGFIQYAYIGPMKVAGLSEMGVRDELAQKLAKYVRQPQVTVRIQTYRSKRVYLDGEVKTPGVEVLNDRPMTLPEAINRAGGFTSNADRSQVAVTREDSTVVVDMPEMIRKGFNPDRIILRDGDLVRVFAQADSKVFVVGEVERPGGVMFNNGHMTLNEALGNAGGINQASGDASQVYVVRGRDTSQPVVFHLDASNASAMATADSFDLKPNDVVFVDTSSLVKWSRVISLILPTTQAAAASRAVGY